MKRIRNFWSRCLLLAAVGCLLWSAQAFAGTWQKDNVGWWYLLDNGNYVANGFCEIDGKWYAFNESGYMRTGWVQDSLGDWHYMDDSGAMLIDAVTPDGKYYLDEDGIWDGETLETTQTSLSTSALERNTAVATVDGETQTYYLTDSSEYKHYMLYLKDNYVYEKFKLRAINDKGHVTGVIELEIDPDTPAGTTLTSEDCDLGFRVTYERVNYGTEWEAYAYYNAYGHAFDVGEFSCTITANENQGQHIAGVFTATVHARNQQDKEIECSFDVNYGETVQWVKDAISAYNERLKEADSYDGGYDSGSSSSSGSSSNQVDHTCRTCRGSGRCTSCAGRGWKTNSYNGKIYDCYVCRGSGRCSICYGTGKVY